jgi:hypothetical protein
MKKIFSVAAAQSALGSSSPPCSIVQSHCTFWSTAPASRFMARANGLDQKHGIRLRRRWRKLHLGVDADTHEIVAVELTPDDVGDVSEVPDLLNQIDAEVASVTADGAYDGEAVYDAVAERHPNATVIIPPRATSVAGETTATQRDQHLAMIDEHGRMGWQRRSGYNQRCLVETAMFRYKTIIGRRLQARTLSNRKTEAKIGCNVLKLNRMARLGMPVSARVH